MCQINRHFAAYHFCPDLHYLFCACRLYHVRGRAEISVAAMWYNASNYDPKTFTGNVFCSTLRLESRGPQLSSRKQLGTCLVRNIPLLRVDKRPQRRLGLLWQGGASRETIRAGSTPPIRNFPRVSSLRHRIAGSCCSATAYVPHQCDSRLTPPVFHHHPSPAERVAGLLLLLRRFL